MNITAYTISRQPVKWTLPIPWLNNSSRINADVYNPHQYVTAIAAKRNETVERLLELYPETTHILCCDEYYVSQAQGVQRLASDYQRLGLGVIMGGGVWGPWRQRISDLGKCRLQWCDRWSVKLPCYHRLVGLPFFPTPAVSGIHIFPRTAWEETRYEAYQDSDLGTEVTWFCQHSGLPCLIDVNAFFHRERKYSIMKCFRCSLALRERLNTLLFHAKA